MPEKSMLWDTGAVSTDGENPYDQEEWSLLFQEMFTRHPDEGPLRTSGSGFDVAGELAVQPGVGKVTVATGRAIVAGFPFRNPDPIEFSVDTPNSTWRADKVFVTADWATKKVRLTYEKNASEGVDNLVAHHVRGDHWDIPLATIIAEPDGFIYCQEARRFCSGTTSVGSDTIGVGAVNHTHIMNRPRRQLHPVFPTNPSDAQPSGDGGWLMVDNKDRTFFAKIAVPDNYAAGDFTLAVIGHATKSGGYWINLKAYGARINRQWDDETFEFPGTVTNLVAGQTTAVAETTLNMYALEGYITVLATRYGTAPGDSDGTFVIDGIRIAYMGTD